MAKNPLYSDYLQYAPTFRWGGREWGEDDMSAFMRKIGGPKRYEKWARKHRVAAKVFDPMEGQIYSAYQPELTGIDAERKKRADYYQRLMANLTGFTTALMGQLGTHAPAIGSAYHEAAETMGAAGEGYGQVLNQSTAATAAKANETLASINAPEGQMVQGGDAGGVLAGLAGWIPETLLNTQGGAFADAAAQLPKSASIESQLMMKGIIDKAMEEEGDFDTRILEILQELPGARSKIRSDAATLKFKQQELNLKKLDSERDWYMKQAYLASAQGDDARANEYLKLAQQRQQQSAWESQGLDANGNVAVGFHRDPKTGQIMEDGWKIGKNGVPVKVGGGGKTGSTSSTVPGTPAYNDKALKAVGAARSKVDASIAGMVTENPKPPFNKIKPTYEDAYKQLWQAYKYLAVNPATTKRLKEVIKNALDAAKIYKHGSAGPVPGSKT